MPEIGPLLQTEDNNLSPDNVNLLIEGSVSAMIDLPL
jgi:hypothetical protein